ncbi:MAG: sigma-70 family RNA polymerase sigma factor [Bacteroidales bacterium]|nr:sigma-70 family RNA polymerase sigma factor [Bacteroidales bacterium]
MGKSFDIELAALRPKVLALTRRFFRSAHLESDPEDIVQDVLFKLWKAKQNGTEIQNAEAWAVRATKNACISVWRKKGTAVSSKLEEQTSSVSDNPALDRIRETEASAILNKTMESFSEGTIKLLRLRASGLSLDEISAITGRSKGSVKSSISAARKILVKNLNI